MKHVINDSPKQAKFFNSSTYRLGTHQMKQYIMFTNDYQVNKFDYDTCNKEYGKKFENEELNMI